MIVEADHPDVGRARQIGSMVKLSESLFQKRHLGVRRELKIRELKIR